jgi:hypothetical protein
VCRSFLVVNIYFQVFVPDASTESVILHSEFLYNLLSLYFWNNKICLANARMCIGITEARHSLRIEPFFSGTFF